MRPPLPAADEELPVVGIVLAPLALKLERLELPPPAAADAEADAASEGDEDGDDAAGDGVWSSRRLRKRARRKEVECKHSSAQAQVRHTASRIYGHEVILIRSKRHKVQ